MRVVQLIDSLEAGGAERMAINYANALSKKAVFSGLIATRNEGLLLSQIDHNVNYLFLKKKKVFDFGAVLRLRKYIRQNEIDFVHAHSSSFFIAVLVKLTFSKVKIIWHDHYGISQDLSSRKSFVLKCSSLFFTGIVSVNSALKEWALSNLLCSNVVYLPNFIEKSPSFKTDFFLAGLKGKRIICVANLRPQKNHALLIKAAHLIRNEFPEWTFHLIGKDFNDSYSASLNQMIINLKLEETVFLYGSIDNVVSVLKQAEIAVLPSLSEGLPLAILEYGLYSLPVVATNVGEVSKVITSKEEGFIVESNDLNQFIKSIKILIKDQNYRKQVGVNLNKQIQFNYSEESIIKKYSSWLGGLLNFIILICCSK